MNLAGWLLGVIGILFYAMNSPIPPGNGSIHFTRDDSVRYKLYNDPPPLSDSVSCIIPFTRAGNLILIQAKADTTTGSFVLDTGAPHLVLNLTYFRKYPASAVTDKGGITGDVSAAFQTSVDSLSFGLIKYGHVDADLISLGHIETIKGVKILGLLGMKLFERFEMIIDYEKSLIYLHQIGKKEALFYKSEMLQDTAAYQAVPIDIVQDKVIVSGTTAGRKLKFVIDSGAETNILDSRLPNKIFENVVITGRINLHGSGDQKVEAVYGDLKNIKIGNQPAATLHVLITNLEQMCLSYDYCIDGVLGFDFLSLHKIGFNFVNHKMYIWK
jgi:Aspartyl protease